MTRILVGTPTVIKYEPFLQSLSEFLYDISKKYEVTHKYIHGKSIEDAHQTLADEAVANYDYLLIIEDDNWGFTADMLDRLIESGKQVIAIPYNSRHFPFLMTSMNIHTDGDDLTKDTMVRYVEAIHEFGIHEVDLIGFGFTLFDTRIFKLLKYPWFRRTRTQSNATDKFFCRKLKRELNIRPFACYDYKVNHRDLTPENVHELRGELIKNGIKTHSL